MVLLKNNKACFLIKNKVYSTLVLTVSVSDFILPVIKLLKMCYIVANQKLILIKYIVYIINNIVYTIQFNLFGHLKSAILTHYIALYGHTCTS